MSRVCVRCGQPVTASAESYEVFEKMHYVCFHYEFEHIDTDVDVECGAGGCPSASVADARAAVIATAQRLAAAADGSWPNANLGDYLDAFAAWIEDSEGYYLNQGRMPPRNGWVIVGDALQAARVYERG
jgi:hypothetical protein